MIQLAMVTTTENWGRPAETTSWGYVDPAEVIALIPQKTRQIDGEYTYVTTIVLKSGMTIEATGTPEDIEKKLKED